MKKNQRFSSTYFTCRSDILFFSCGVVMLASEIWKQLTLTVSVNHGTYIWWYLPFQLCSIPMYVLLAYPWLRREILRRSALAFLMSYSLLGGTAVFADTSGLHYPLFSLTLHSYLWHILLILLGVSAGIVFLRRLLAECSRRDCRKTVFPCALTPAFPLRPFLYSTFLYLFCCLAAECLNLSLDGRGTINMFYINSDYEMQQILFRDLVPLIGNTAAILVYIGATVLGAFLFYLLWELFFRLALRLSRRH